jgi:hypothetical protein
MKTPTTLRRTLRAGLLAAATAAILGGAAMAPAMADDWHRGAPDRYAHDWRGHDRFDHRPAVYGYGYAYPPGYGYGYAPAPVYPAPALNLGFVFR